MRDDLEKVVTALAGRGKQRGFLMVGEVQQELEEAEAPPESFEVAFAELLAKHSDSGDEDHGRRDDAARHSGDNDVPVAGQCSRVAACDRSLLFDGAFGHDRSRDTAKLARRKPRSSDRCRFDPSRNGTQADRIDLCTMQR